MTMHAEANYSAEYRADHARLARLESGAAKTAAALIRTVRGHALSLFANLPACISKDTWEDVLAELDSAAEQIGTHALTCRERADELEHEPLNADGQ